MIDGICIHFQDSWIKDSILERISSSEARTFGWVNGLRVTKNVHGTLVKGSLPKLLYKTNFHSIGKNDYKEALSEIQRITNLSPARGRVMSIELGQTFMVDHHCRSYLSTWGLPIGRYVINRWNNNQTVAYVNRQRTFQGYDKIAEMKGYRGNVSLPKNKHALRLELRINRGLKKVMGCQNHLGPVDLLDDTNWLKLNRLWKEFYFSIPKVSSTIIPTDEAFTKEIRRFLEMGGVQFFTPETLYNRLQDCQRIGLIDRHKAYRARSFIREVEGVICCQNVSDLTQELDSKVASYQS